MRYLPLLSQFSRRPIIKRNRNVHDPGPSGASANALPHNMGPPEVVPAVVPAVVSVTQPNTSQEYVNPELFGKGKLPMKQPKKRSPSAVVQVSLQNPDIWESLCNTTAPLSYAHWIAMDSNAAKSFRAEPVFSGAR